MASAVVNNKEDTAPPKVTIPVIDQSHRLKNNGYGKARSTLPTAGLTNYADEDFATWDLNGDVDRNGTVPNEAGSDTVPIFDLITPEGGNNNVMGVSSMTSGATGKTLYLRVRMKAIAFREPDPDDRVFNKARVEIWLRNGSNFGQVVVKIFRIGFDWDWYEVRFPNPTGDTTWQHFIGARAPGDPIDIAIDAVELFAY